MLESIFHFFGLEAVKLLRLWHLANCADDGLNPLVLHIE